MVWVGFKVSMLAAVAVPVAAVLTPFQDIARAYTQEEEQLCTGDAFRLCSAEIPDVDRVTACMVRNKSRLSPGCRAVFESPPAAQTAKAGKPARLQPTKASFKKRRVVKPKPVT